MNKFQKFLIGLLIVVICIVLVTVLVAGIMSAIHNCTVRTEFLDWWHAITEIFKKIGK